MTSDSRSGNTCKTKSYTCITVSVNHLPSPLFSSASFVLHERLVLQSGRPVTSVSDENIEKVRKLITKHRRVILHIIAVMMRIMRVIHALRPQYAQQGSRFFVHDNAHLHTANIVKQFLIKKRGANSTSIVRARSLSSRLHPIPTTQTRFERKEV
ncbi:hypothetical protein TNCV_4364101 [Trichonephila clavipes]|nr:hypothetical protein TNCV_4364101 [Trichonephila clavipes]